MSKIGDLKANENHKVNLVKILELFCNGDTKYVEMLLRLYKTNSDSTTVKVNAINKRTNIEIEKIKSLSDNEIEVMYHFIDNTMLMSNIKEFQKFINYNERNLIDDKDLQEYKSFIQISGSVKKADEKIALKELEKQIKKIYEDDQWLILIPLTYESSVKYGYNTKWCTASESTSEQYKSYTRDGLLIYIIEKGKNKTAVYKKSTNGEVSFWNQVDTRIDSIQTNFPSNIMDVIKTALNEKHDTRYNPKTGITDLSDFTSPDGLTGLTMDYINELLGTKTPFGNTDAVYNDLASFQDYATPKKSSPNTFGGGFGMTRGQSVIDTSGSIQDSLNWGGDNSGGGSRGIHKTDAVDAQIKAYEQLLNLNSPDYISKVKNLMNRLK